MRARTDGAWFNVAMDAWWLGAESSYVAGLRLSRMATGSLPILAETQLMITEKIQAALELQTDAFFGALGSTPLAASRRALGHYRRKVSANRQRLSR